MYDLVKQMHQKFGINYGGPPRSLPVDEFEFRIKAFEEEIQEYCIGRDTGSLEEQLDALIDLMAFTFGACEKHGFDIEEAFERVMQANMTKQLAGSSENSKRGHSTDLIKPEGWWPPYLQDLLEEPKEHKGIIILDGPDGCGKTTLAKHLEEKYGAYYMHLTWSEKLNERMFDYMAEALLHAERIAKNKLVVIDRHMLSELVYATVYRDGSVLKPHEQNMLWNNINIRLRARTIVCLPNQHPIEIVAHFNGLKEQRQEMYSNIHEVIVAYMQLWDGVERIEYSVFKDYDRGMTNSILINGLHTFLGYHRYDWRTDGENMDKFILPILMEMKHEH